MGDSHITLVPERFDIAPAEQAFMETRMVGWMQKNGWIEKEKSDCVLSSEAGWRFTPSGSLHMTGEPEKRLLTYGFRVEKHAGKGVFTNLEGGLESACCPACGKDVERYFYDMVGEWYEADGFPPVQCPLCGVASDIRAYRLDPLWGFSQIGFEFWNTGPLRPEFVEEFTAMLGEPVRVVWAHL